MRREHQGYVLVLENATELLRAQKQSAWKEVARRVAHEIKNPLTPISLSAEQIRRHIDRLAAYALQEHAIESPSHGGHSALQRGDYRFGGEYAGLVDQFACAGGVSDGAAEACGFEYDRRKFAGAVCGADAEHSRGEAR